MKDILEALQATPVPNILVISGALFLLLAFVGKIGSFIEIPEKRQKWSAMMGVLLLIFGTSIFISSKANKSKKSEEINIKTSSHELSSEELADIIQIDSKDPKELTKKYFNKSVSFKGSVTGSYSDENYMVVWVGANNTYIGCLSAPSNKKFKQLKSGNIVVISGVIHHIENELSLGNKLVLAHGCKVER